MPEDFLTAEQAKILVEEYMAKEDKTVSTQEILDSGAVPALKGFHIRPGKVSDSIPGGKIEYLDKSTGQMVEFENPPLVTKQGLAGITAGLSLRPMVRTERIQPMILTEKSFHLKHKF